MPARLVSSAIFISAATERSGHSRRSGDVGPSLSSFVGHHDTANTTQAHQGRLRFSSRHEPEKGGGRMQKYGVGGNNNYVLYHRAQCRSSGLVVPMSRLLGPQPSSHKYGNPNISIVGRIFDCVPLSCVASIPCFAPVWLPTRAGSSHQDISCNMLAISHEQGESSAHHIAHQIDHRRDCYHYDLFNVKLWGDLMHKLDRI